MSTKKDKPTENKEMNPESITLYLPADAGAYVEGCLNGKNFRVKTGTFVEVPRYIAQILLASGRARAVSAQNTAAFAAPGGKGMGLLS